LKQYSLEGVRVLLLEDEYLIAIDVEHLCREHGAKDITIAHTVDAVDATLPYDVAILDVMLSGQNTLEFAKELALRDVPFVFATGYTDTADMFSSLDMSVPQVEIISKPYSSDTLIAALARAIAGKKGNQAGVDPITCDDIASGP
jgi:DNA-binding response OmpR family regulator